jgi:peptidoglycan-N-acetylglucosamine deacetylase
VRAWLIVIPLALVLPFVAETSRVPPEPNLEVSVDGQPLILPPAATVADALAKAERVPVDGRLLSVVTASVLDPAWDPAVITVDGRERRPGNRLRTGDAVVVVDGTDAVEGTATTQAPVPPDPLPDIERFLWTPGADGLQEGVLGEVSGEVVSSTILQAPVQPSRVGGQIAALTFDDGPNSTYTPLVLAALDEAGVKATFCMVGNAVRANPDLVREIRDRGHALCAHSETHADLTTLSAEAVEGEVAGSAAAIAEVAGEAPAFFRAPYGAVNQNVLDSAHANGMRVFGWSVDPQDFERPRPRVLIDSVVGAVTPGGVVLLHDGGGDRMRTVTALPRIIKKLEREGYAFVRPTV